MFFCGWFVAPSTRILTQFDTAAVSDLKPNTIKGIGEKQGVFSKTLTQWVVSEFFNTIKASGFMTQLAQHFSKSL